MLEETKNTIVFIDPSSESYYNNLLFDGSNEYLNRDNCLAPYIYLKRFLEEKGYRVFTADYLIKGEVIGKRNIYISFGIFKNYKELSKMKDVILSAFFIFEPPVVAPNIYRQIPILSRYFEKIFIHTLNKDFKKYTKKVKNIYKFHWPQSYNGVLEEYWNNNKRKFLTIINGNKKPNLKENELYSKRIEAIVFFSQYDEIDLYGFGWNKPILYMPYLLSRKLILKSYKGPVKSKYETLSKYKFAICFENMILSGYITEKIFDCFFAGTIPVYLGAPDIENFVPKECFIDMRDFSNYSELRNYLHSLSDEDIQKYRENTKEYLGSEKYKLFSKEYFAEFVYKSILEYI